MSPARLVTSGLGRLAPALAAIVPILAPAVRSGADAATVYTLEAKSIKSSVSAVTPFGGRGGPDDKPHATADRIAHGQDPGR